MRVLFDSEIFERQRAGGISRYFVELIGALRSERLARVVLPFLFTENIHLAEKWYRFGKVPLPNRLVRRHKDWYLHRVNSALTQRALSRGRPDIFHKTYYDMTLLKNFDGRLVVTVYDMIPELLPEHFPNSTTVHPHKREQCERADAVLCISGQTRADLMRLFGVAAEKITVTHLGIKPHWGSRKCVVADLPAQYVLFVGDRRGYKNFRQVTDAIGRLARRFPDLHLVCVGGAPFTPAESEHFVQSNLSPRVHWRRLSDPELAYCYSKAALFVFPSLYEGFGLPTLEAFACSCPVILSNRSCFPEIGEDAVRYFDPDTPGFLEDEIERLLNDDDERQKLITRGTSRLRCFSWQKTAEQTAEVYRRLV